jgi:predicted ATPase
VVERGSVTDGIAQIQWGIAANRDIGAEVYQSYYLSLLAEAYQKDGQVEEGLAAVAAALAFVTRTEERFYEAEVYRIKGELTLQSKTSLGQVEGQSPASLEQVTTSQGQSQASLETESEACFLKAIEVAQKQQAKSLELRAVMSLARLRQHQGKRAEAHRMLSEIYGWFTEGFDTKDLQEAQALLQDLGEMAKGGNGEMENG